jgi:signal transduction histidine kinase
MAGNIKKNQRFNYIHKGCTEAYLDPSLLKYIIINLISNASKFSGENAVIDIRTTLNKREMVLAVSDRGIGISKDDQKHLMERFFRGANVANIQGTGLGLHIVSKYAELMNGRVQCVSELEKGTKFILTFDQTMNSHENHTFN